ncbi:MAG: hypothetical protein WC831_01835 [Parcubacteria group bacterium]|jgi:hypothetical protein
MWVAISGSWRRINGAVKRDVETTVSQILSRGDGIVSGGFPGVDYVATVKALRHCPNAEKIRIILPVTLELYALQYADWVGEGAVSDRQARSVLMQLSELKEINPRSIVENRNSALACCSGRNTAMIRRADSLEAFYINLSKGEDTINTAFAKGIPVRVRTYAI